MKNYKKNVSRQGIYLKKRISKTHARAEFVGLVYLFSIFALVGVACLPLISSPSAPVGVMEFWKVFTLSNLKATKDLEAGAIIVLSNATLYALMLFGLAINALRALAKLGWLFKKKGSKKHSFNRNVYAMEDLGNLFSGSFASIVIFHFLIYVICGSAEIQPLAYILLGGGLCIHFFCGFVGGKCSYFDSDAQGNLIEQKRLIGRIAPLIRNLLQVAAVGGMLFFFLRTNVLSLLIAPLLQKGAFGGYIKNNLTAFISAGLQILTIPSLFVLIKHATGTSEYSIEGTAASGMKNFRVFSFFVALTAGATAVCRYLFGEVGFGLILENGVTSVLVLKFTDYKSVMLAGIAFAMFVIELIMSGLPRFPENREEDEIEEYDEDEELSFAEEMTARERCEAPIARIIELDCPICGRPLEVKSDHAHHRCPVCGEVFELVDRADKSVR